VLGKREWYLNADDFKRVFKCDREEFYALPQWKQDKAKKRAGLY